MIEAQRYFTNKLTKDKVLRAIGYFMLALSGVWMIASPPPAYWGALGPVLYGMLAGGLLAGIPAAVACLFGRFRVEYVALPLMIASLSSFTAILIVRVVVTFSGVAAATCLAAFAALLMARWLALHSLAAEWKKLHPAHRRERN